MSHTIDEAQVSSMDGIRRTVQEIGITTAEAIYKSRLEDLEATVRLESHLERLLVSQETASDTTTNICAKLTDISIAQSTSTDLIIQTFQPAFGKLMKATPKHSFGVINSAQEARCCRDLNRCN
jgi:hypothetical protein